MRKTLKLISFLLVPLFGFSQITLCNNATPVCGDLIFNNTINQPSYGSISCCNTTPNSHWSILKIGNPGNLDLSLTQGNNAPDFNNLDVDFICWGPFNDIPDCSIALFGYPIGNVVTNNIIDCSYSASATEQINIQNAQSGKFYVILTTNFANYTGTIKLSTLPTSTATTICDYAVVNDAPDNIEYQSTVNFNVSTLNVTNYQWQRSTDGTNWSNLVNGGLNPTVSGATSNFLTLTNTPINYSGNYFRTQLTTPTETVFSTSARITNALNSNSFNNDITNQIVINEGILKIENLEGEIKFFNIQGKEIFSKNILPYTELDITNFDNGIYILVYKDKNSNIYNKKVIKN